MKKNISTPKLKVHSFKILLMAMAFAFGSFSAAAQAFTEDFATVPPTGWARQNLGTPPGLLPDWFQGDDAIFPAQNGAANSFAGCSFESVTGANTISNWLFTPTVTLSNGDQFSFYTRKATPNPTDFPDRMQIRMSTSGSSVDVGITNTSVGVFTTLLLEINAAQAVGGYPLVWTQYSITVSGLGAPISGRFAFRYFVTNGGPDGSNSDYIGVDNVVYTPVVIVPVTLSNFSGYYDGHRPQLRWTTESEQNNSGFEVQRSIDGINYISLAFVKSLAAGGNSSTTLHYTFADNNTRAKNIYYRLRQVNVNGDSKISNVVFIKGNNPVSLTITGLYPNPSYKVINLLIEGPKKEDATVVITDMAGKIIIRKSINAESGSTILPIDISTIRPGAYLVKLVCGSNCETAVSKFMKQ